MLLDVQGIDVCYGRNHAVKSVDLTMDEREIVTVLGANGAGKSSLLKAIQGSEKSTGTVLFDGVDISGWSAPRRVNAGLVLVPEGRQIFVSMTVHENMQMGAYCRKDDVGAEIDEIYDRFPNLAARRDMPASVLSGGEQQMLAIGRIKSLGMTTIIVEQSAIAALQLADRAIILTMGQIVFDGTAQDVLDNADLRQPYLAI